MANTSLSRPGLRFLLNLPLGGADGVVGLLPFTTAVASAVAVSVGVSASFFCKTSNMEKIVIENTQVKPGFTNYLPRGLAPKN